MSSHNIEQHGIKNVAAVLWNLTTSALYEKIVYRQEGLIAHLGPVVVRTGAYTGRSPKDKFIVYEPTSAHHIAWGEQNCSMAPEKFGILHVRLLAFLQGRELFIQDCYAGADPVHRIPIRVITTQAWQNFFARNLFGQIKMTLPAEVYARLFREKVERHKVIIPFRRLPLLTPISRASAILAI